MFKVCIMMFDVFLANIEIFFNSLMFYFITFNKSPRFKIFNIWRLHLLFELEWWTWYVSQHSLQFNINIFPYQHGIQSPFLNILIKTCKKNVWVHLSSTILKPVPKPLVHCLAILKFLRIPTIVLHVQKPYETTQVIQ